MHWPIQILDLFSNLHTLLIKRILWIQIWLEVVFMMQILYTVVPNEPIDIDLVPAGPKALS